jgi:hypothetical protein
VYARTVNGEELSFGVSGMLWRDNLVMYDRQTESWWAQADGRAIRGPKRGAVLQQVPSDMMTWKQWRVLHPATRVLAPPAARGTTRDVYASYHRSRDVGVTGRTRRGGALDAKRLVVGFRLGRGAFAVPLDIITKAGVRQVTAAGQALVAVALADGSSARVFRAGKDRFEAAGQRDGRLLLRDTATDSIWDGFDGRAISGPRENERLTPVTAHVSYWFSWFSFYPDTTVLDSSVAQ